MITEIKNCPFCGSSDVLHGEVTTNLGARLVTQSECQQCGALGPYVDIRNVGIGKEDKLSEDAWSRRPALTAFVDNAESVVASSTFENDVDLGEGLPPLPMEIEVGGEGWAWEDFQAEKTFSADHMIAYGRACAAVSAPNAALVAALHQCLIAFDNIEVPEGGLTGYDSVIHADAVVRAALSAAGQERRALLRQHGSLDTIQ